MYDVVVAGSGPAGSTAARSLARRGFRVLVLEAVKVPQRKTCGGGIPLRAVARYGIPEDIGIHARTAFFRGPGGSGFHYDHGRPLVLLAPRERLHSFLVERAVEAGATLTEGTRVVDVKVGEEGVVLRDHKGREYRGRALVVADGFNSVLRDRLGMTPDGWWRENALCLVSYVPFRGGEELEADMEFYMRQFGEGYVWVFRHEDHLNIGMGTFYRNYPRDVRAPFNEFLGWRLPRLGIRGRQRIVGAFIPCRGVIRKTYAERAVLVGDAAGFVSPVSGEGIYMAMRSGEIAADVLAKALEEGEPTEEALAEYQRRWLRDPELGGDLAYGNVVAKLLYDRNLLDGVMALCSEDRNAARLVVEMVFTLRRYREVLAELSRRFPLGLKLTALRRHAVDLLRLSSGRVSPFFPG